MVSVVVVVVVMMELAVLMRNVEVVPFLNISELNMKHKILQKP